MLVTGRDVNVGPTSNRIPALKLGLYGNEARGVIDVDNVITTDGRDPTPDPIPTPQIVLGTPTQVRIVAGS